MSGVESGVARVAGQVRPDDVARYYDRNTRRFLLASARGTYSMHRELWGPDVRSAAQATAHVDRLVGDEIGEALGAKGAGAWPCPDDVPLVIDFGCGVGGTLFHLAERFPCARLVGVTVSGRQVEIAERIAGRLGHAERSSFTRADFQTLDLGVGADAIVAVESFAHSEGADAFLASAARHLRPGGRLVIADDFLARDAGALAADERRRVEQLRAGWRVPTLCTAEQLGRAARAHGLHVQKVADLTALTRPGRRVRDRLIGLLSPLLVGLRLGRMPFYGNMIGGNALQIGLRRGFIRYQLVTLSRGS